MNASPACLTMNVLRLIFMIMMTTRVCECNIKSNKVFFYFCNVELIFKELLTLARFGQSFLSHAHNVSYFIVLHLTIQSAVTAPVLIFVRAGLVERSAFYDTIKPFYPPGRNNLEFSPPVLTTKEDLLPICEISSACRDRKISVI